MYPKLTPQEQKIMECFAQGMSNKETASYLACAWKTVDAHSQSILRKYGVTNTRRLMSLYALQRVAESLSSEQLKFTSIADLFRETPDAERMDGARLRLSRKVRD